MTTPVLPPFSKRIGDLELRTCDENLLQRRSLVTMEIIKWTQRAAGPDFCFVVAMWRRDREGNYGLEFIGDRPFHETLADFWDLAKFGQEFLAVMEIGLEAEDEA